MGDARHDCGPVAAGKTAAADQPRRCVWARREVFCIRALCASSMMVLRKLVGAAVTAPPRYLDVPAQSVSSPRVIQKLVR